MLVQLANALHTKGVRQPNVFIYSRHAQHTARGPNVARESFQFGPQSPNLPIFGLIFDENNVEIAKNSTNLARECFSNTFLARHEI